MIIEDNEYIIYCISDDNAYKIGYTNNAMQRLSMLQIGNPRELKYVFKYQIENIILAKRIEKACHVKYKKYNIRGEWFDNINIDELFNYIISIHKELLKYNDYITNDRFDVLENDDDIIFSMKFLIDVMRTSKLSNPKEISEYFIKYNITDWSERTIISCLDTITLKKNLENWSY